MFIDLILGMLETDYTKRFNLQKVFDHPFFVVLQENYYNHKQRINNIKKIPLVKRESP